MATAVAAKAAWKGILGPSSAGLRMTPLAFDRAEFEEGWRYELIDGVLVVSPIPLESERDPNEELGFLLRSYKRNHPEGWRLDKTLPEQTVRTRRNRRRADRVIWAGLGRVPRKTDVPTVVVEFVSKGKRSWLRDYQEKRAEYKAIGVKEYRIIDRFRRIMTVYQTGKLKKRIVREDEVYTTELLPGFELPLRQLLALADDWKE